jgi:hypothetical protein
MVNKEGLVNKEGQVRTNEGLASSASEIADGKRNRTKRNRDRSARGDEAIGTGTGQLGRVIGIRFVASCLIPTLISL